MARTKKRYKPTPNGNGYSNKRGLVPICAKNPPRPGWLRKRDHRRAEVRWYLSKATQIAIDRGSVENLSTITQNQIEQFVRVAVRCEHHWHELELNPNADDAAFLACVHTLSKLAAMIGLDRVSKPTQTLQTFLESRAEAPAQAEG